MTADSTLQFCTADAVFGNGTTETSADWVDMKVAQDNAGGKEIVVEILVTTTFAGGTSATFQLTAVDSAGANPVVLAQTKAYAVADLTAPPAGNGKGGGTVVHLRADPLTALPAGTLTHLRLQCVNVGNNTAGAITAYLVPEAASAKPAKAYASGW
jgi:hypothetical protein